MQFLPHSYVVIEVNITEVLKSSTPVVQRAAAPKNGVQFHQRPISAISQKSHVPVFIVDIWKSKQNVRLANKPKLDIAHEYSSLSEDFVLECRLYPLVC